MGPRMDGPPPLKKLILPALFVGGLFYVTWTRTPETPPQVVVYGEALGTTWTLKVSDAPTQELEDKLRTIVTAALDDVDASMSTYRSDSELMKFNKSEALDPVELSDGLGAVIAEAMDVGSASGGAFDVTVGPLVNAWGFGPDKRPIVPSEETMQSIQAHVGLDKLELTERGLAKSNPEVFVDLSAIAKGYAVDRVVADLERAGFTDLLMEVGGEIVARGRNPTGATWRLGIETPTEDGRDVFHVVPLLNAAMATSGDYRQFYEVDGRRTSHLIDPRTGQPIEHRLASVTVVHERCSKADAWATALSVMGEQEGFALAEQQGLSAYFIVRNEDGAFETLVTDSFEALKE